MTPINHIIPNSEIQKLTGVISKRKLEERPSGEMDGLFISEEAKNLQQRQRAIEIAKKEIEKMPAVRKELVAQIREKLTNGEYLQLSDEVARVIAEKIVDGLYLSL